MGRRDKEGGDKRQGERESEGKAKVKDDEDEGEGWDLWEVFDERKGEGVCGGEVYV